jgi:Leucine-rich repeat (LRR) protein
MYIHLPAQLSLPALRRLSLYEFANIAPFHVDCRALQELHYWDYMSDHLPTGLTECSITVLDIGVPYWGAQAPSRADSFATIEGLRASLEVLDISGWGLEALPQWFGSLPRLHTLRAADNKLSLLPSLPATLVALDLRGNHFTEVPMQLETFTHLTSLMMCSAYGNHSMLQIRHGLRPLIGLPNLRLLSFEPRAPDNEVLYVEDDFEAYEVWSAKSLYYLGQAEHQIIASNSKLQLKF